MACPILKTLQISFTPPSPAPTNGYRIKWRVVGTSTYTTAVGPFTTSPAVLTNIPACENIEGTVEAVCGSTYSSVATFSATKQASFVCGNTVSDSSNSATFMTYGKKLFDFNNSADEITLSYDVANIPNRFNIYNSDDTLIATSGWKGIASYAGPWGASINTLTTGTVTFKKSEKGGDQRWYYLTVEHAGNATTSDSWTTTLSCASGGGGGLAGAATYAIVPSVTSVNEGGTVVFTITTTNVGNGTSLYYTTTGSVVDADFNDNSIFGTVVINNNTATITKVIKADVTTEGPESFALQLRIQSYSGTVVATSSTVTIVDSSVTPTTVTYYDVERCDVPGATGVIRYDGTGLTNGTVVKSTNGNCYTILGVSGLSENSSGIVTSEHSDCADCLAGAGSTTPTYAINGSPSTVNEGATVTFTVTTTNVLDGTSLYYVVSGGSGLTAGDFQDGALSGQITVNGNTATITKAMTADVATEGPEAFSVLLKTGSVFGPTVATSNNITVVDTSTTAPTTYSILLEPESYYEGSQDCLGTMYDTQKTKVKASLIDSNGNPVNALSNITVTFNTLTSPCYGGAGYQSQYSVVIPAGQSFALSSPFTSYAIVDCGQYGCQQETMVYDCAVSNSANYNWAAGTSTCPN